MSWDATFTIFNWHRNNEGGGLWLAEGSEDADDVVRKKNSHKWIRDNTTNVYGDVLLESGGSENGIGEGDDSKKRWRDGIKRWQDDIMRWQDDGVVLQDKMMA